MNPVWTHRELDGFSQKIDFAGITFAQKSLPTQDAGVDTAHQGTIGSMDSSDFVYDIVNIFIDTPYYLAVCALIGISIYRLVKLKTSLILLIAASLLLVLPIGLEFAGTIYASISNSADLGDVFDRLKQFAFSGLKCIPILLIAFYIFRLSKRPTGPPEVKRRTTPPRVQNHRAGFTPPPRR